MIRRKRQLPLASITSSTFCLGIYTSVSVYLVFYIVYLSIFIVPLCSVSINSIFHIVSLFTVQCTCLNCLYIQYIQCLSIYCIYLPTVHIYLQLLYMYIHTVKSVYSVYIYSKVYLSIFLHRILCISVCSVIIYEYTGIFYIVYLSIVSIYMQCFLSVRTKSYSGHHDYTTHAQAAAYSPLPLSRVMYCSEREKRY